MLVNYRGAPIARRGKVIQWPKRTGVVPHMVGELDAVQAVAVENAGGTPADPGDVQQAGPDQPAPGERVL